MYFIWLEFYNIYDDKCILYGWSFRIDTLIDYYNISVDDDI